MDLHDDLSQRNNEKSSFPSTHPPATVLPLTYKTEDCYVIHNNACIYFNVFLLFCYFYVKILIMQSLSISLAPRIFAFPSSSDGLCPRAQTQT